MASSGRRLWRDLLLPPKLLLEKEEKGIPVGFPSPGSSSNLSSPVMSDRCSIETAESGCDDDCRDGGDDGDYIVQLAFQMAHNMLQEADEDDNITAQNPSPHNPKFWGLSGSPQSTLCQLGNCESPKGVCETGLSGGAGKLEKINPCDEGPTWPNIYQSLKAVEDDPLRPEKGTKQRERGNWRKGGRRMAEQGEGKQEISRNPHSGGGGGKGRDFGRPVNGGKFRRRQQKQRPREVEGGSGMLAIFLDRSASKCGTGVFLPPGVGHSTDSSKKPGCSLALIPARVVQALKLNPNDLGVVAHSKSVGFHQQPGNDGVGAPNHVLFPKEAGHRDIGLPKDWTY